MLQLLKNHLTLSTIKHDIEILKETTLKNAHIYCVVNNISAQQFGPLLESYICLKNMFTKNSASNCNGDLSFNNINIEVKVSLGGSKHNKFNWVQIRLSHDIQYYMLTAYHLNHGNVENFGDLYTFIVPKKDMRILILKYGGYAHGTIKEHGKIVFEDMDTQEYALRPTYGDRCWLDMLVYSNTSSPLPSEF